MASDQDFTLLVAAVDFGTTFTGYAFSTISDKKDIKMNKNWGEEMNQSSYKAPTCVLVDPHKKFVSFGYKAENDFLQLSKEQRSGDDKNRYNLFRNFKMLLHKAKITSKAEIMSTTGTKMLAKDIFAMTLRFLKDHMLEAINNALTRNVEDSTIQWVLTVPAIWREDAKQFMREACFEAGLINQMTSRKLIIALEPEAASMYCRHLDLGGLHGDGQQVQVYFGKNDNYMVVDAGGGTVDITCHHLDEAGHIKEICAPSGGAWGGIYVDERFEKLLEEIFSAEFIKKFKHNNPGDWKSLFISFEKSKPSVKVTTNNSINLSISYGLGKAVKEHFKPQKPDQVINAKKDLGVSFKNGSLMITHEKAKQLFEPVIMELVKHLREMIKTHFARKKLKYVILVGGFSQSELFQEAVKELFKSKSTKVLIPTEAQLAIVKGAVHFGHDPSAISHRIAKLSYGIEVMRPFDPTKHNDLYKAESDGITWCTNLFKPIFRKGDEIEVGTEENIQVGTNVDSRIKGSTKIEIYSANERDVMYTSGYAVKLMATLTVQHAGTLEDYAALKQPINLVVTFGGTELKFKAKTEKSKKWVDVSVSFSGD